MATWTPNQSYLETASVFGTKKLKGMKEVQGHSAKEGRQEIFCLSTDELGYKIQNFGLAFLFFNFIE